MASDFGFDLAARPTEVVLLPGAFGVHLADRSGDRLWLDAEQIARGDIPDKLALDASGERDLDPSLDVRPTRVLDFIYDPLVKHLEDANLRVLPYLFDYRKSILAAARGLRDFIAANTTPGARVWLLSHSIG